MLAIITITITDFTVCYHGGPQRRESSLRRTGRQIAGKAAGRSDRPCKCAWNVGKNQAAHGNVLSNAVALFTDAFPLAIMKNNGAAKCDPYAGSPKTEADSRS